MVLSNFFIIIIIIPFPTDYSLDLKMQFNHFLGLLGQVFSQC